ncbi:uncharacterized protein PHALS_06085 [Plasmopara halstedii]|uniref:Uncharacterized protein n=1 Tax=Plasmopara halstedii TaxID=4781 RepID=A0A0P1AAY5_PLAHL|nr:uncharacterized protein PHALS_06085 [Plasmopara halstedii]CEG38047.1 hypothetical protein PHALS_06085 [Plasmopara halstedii]|eukprot:XP_024574416.1 hypothetical protein PHALS_06085 [Plasmopara halstedii]
MVHIIRFASTERPGVEVNPSLKIWRVQMAISNVLRTDKQLRGSAQELALTCILAAEEKNRARLHFAPLYLALWNH